jgi:MSHA biogenesis protein MshK
MLLLAPLLVATAAPAQTFRDPMRPPGSAPATARLANSASLNLEGVISGTARVAIVNGRLVRAGDEVGGARIIEVLINGVRYSRAGHVQTLLLPGVHPFSRVRVARTAEASKP